MDPTQTYYLEKNGQFWEMEVNEKCTTIRFGKIGKPGRKLAAKQHGTSYKAKQFAIRQVNGKIIQGFQDPNVVIPRAPMVKLLSKRSSIRIQRIQTLKRQSTLKSAANQIRQTNISLKKQSTQQVRKLQKGDTVAVKHTDVSRNRDMEMSRVTHKLQWRKPPKKQSTVRRNARQISAMCKKNSEKISPCGKNEDVQSSSTENNTPASVSRQDTVSLSQGHNREDMLLQNKGSTLLPVLDKKRSSWGKPRLSNMDLSMPNLTKETH